MKYFIGLDIGTSSIKGVMVSENGNEKTTAREPFYYEYPELGRVQSRAEYYLTVCFRLLRKLVGALPEDGEIGGISEASASGNLLLLDGENKPLTPIFSWQSECSSEEDLCVLGESFDKAAYYDIVGWGLCKGFPLPELCRIKRKSPELLNKAKKVCMSTEYLNFVLTGKWGISGSAGTPFYLINQKTEEYYKPVLEKLGIEENQLPPIIKTGAQIGTITADGERLCGIKKGVPVFAGSFDHPSAAQGAGVTQEGQLLLSCGTSWVGFFPVAKREKIIENHLLCDPFLSPEGCWGAMFSIPSVTTNLEWYIKKYISDGENMYKELDRLAESVDVCNLRINPYEKKEICGYSRQAIARAVLESVGWLLKDKLDELAANGITAESAVMAGGPTSSKIWIRIIKKIIKLPISVADGAFSGAVGAAQIAQRAKKERSFR